MRKGNESQKQKMLYLAKIFLEETDEEHGLTLAEISQKLELMRIPATGKRCIWILKSFGALAWTFSPAKRVPPPATGW